MKSVFIHTEFIRLDACLKLCAVVGTGGEAKALIQEGYVLVNGEICMQRGRKLYPGDVVVFDSESFVITNGEII